MKYICLGYYDEKAWEAVPEDERNALMAATALKRRLAFRPGSRHPPR